jgi:mono/diheme cytochrome c family protein
MFRVLTVILGGLLVSSLTVVTGAAMQSNGNPAAAKIKNPVPATAASIKTGEQLFQKNCVFCHGPKGLGDGKLVPKDMHPANLSDDKWDRGSTDGEIHAVIMGGIPDKKMPGLKGRVTEADAWHIVNFIRSLGPQAAH